MKLWENQQIKYETLTQILRDPEEIKRLHSRKANLGDDDPPPFPPKIAQWLGDLKLLHGVPFNYLVPDERMLPLESIRFFYVDSVWLDYLVEGAFSIGRAKASDLAHDTAFARPLHAHTTGAMRNARKMIVSQAVNATNTDITSLEKVTGFLLRSEVVSGWPGMEIEAYPVSPIKPETLPMEILRMEHLAPNVILCFYEGVIKELHIHEHPENLHFGVDPGQTSGTYTKSLRYLEKTVVYDPVKHESVEYQPGEQIVPAVDLKNIADYFRKGEKRVLRINDLAGRIQADLKAATGYSKTFTAAEFSLEMVEGTNKVIFRFEN